MEGIHVQTPPRGPCSSGDTCEQSKETYSVPEQVTSPCWPQTQQVTCVMCMGWSSRHSNGHCIVSVNSKMRLSYVGWGVVTHSPDTSCYTETVRLVTLHLGILQHPSLAHSPLQKQEGAPLKSSESRNKSPIYPHKKLPTTSSESISAERLCVPRRGDRFPVNCSRGPSHATQTISVQRRWKPHTKALAVPYYQPS